MMVRWVLVASALAFAACQPDTCSDVECMMSHFQLAAEDGSPVELTEVAGTMVALPPDGMPDTSAPSGSFNLLIVPVSVPNFGDPLEMVENGIPIYAGTGTSDASIEPVITNQPADIHFLGTDSVRDIELDFTDPNGETPAFYFVVSDPKTGRMYPHCVWMTHAERDMIRQGVVKLKAGITGYVDFGSGFYQGTCNSLPPFHSPTTPPGGVERCPTGFFACGPGCLPNGMSCGPGDGETGCASGQHLCLNRGPGCTAQPCCDYYSPDPSCCPNGPKSPPCLPPNVAGDPVRIAAVPTAPPDGSGGGGSGGGGGGGGSGGGSCPGGTFGSLRSCVVNGIGGPCDCFPSSAAGMCVTPAFWSSNGFSGPFPTQCTTQGGNCTDASGRVMNAVCCAGLSCNLGGGNSCGGGIGTCQTIN